ncbi:MAG TPA: hypothetical protein VNV87_09915 [Acidimicrobiales bacterium]|nr:hypothetical protein [Acidimicrobiales bacterium]
MSDDLADVADRLSAISESLADLAIDRLRQASDSVRAGGEPDPVLVAEEKRITRARRAVDKAATLLSGTGGAGGSASGFAFEDGP